MAVKIAIAGAAGRMGKRLLALAATDSELDCVAAFEGPKSPDLGRDAGELAGTDPIGVAVTRESASPFDVLIDFTVPEATMQWLDLCRDRAAALVSGTTGLTDDQSNRIAEASSTIPVLHSPNMSVGVNVVLQVARSLAGILDASYDVEITEAHHRFKIDAPSGTALALRDAVIQGRSDRGAPEGGIAYGRQGRTGRRPEGEIGIHSLRTGDTVGQHTLSFGTIGETITIGHTAHSRDTFAVGALRAAKWIAGRSPGMYEMLDVLSAKA